MPPAGYVQFRWKTFQYDRHNRGQHCPRCGKFRFVWGGVENAGLQVDGCDETYAALERSGRTRPGHHGTGDCRRWTRGECSSCRLKFWHDFISEVLKNGRTGDWAYYCEDKNLKPRWHVRVETVHTSATERSLE